MALRESESSFKARSWKEHIEKEIRIQECSLSETAGEEESGRLRRKEMVRSGQETWNVMEMTVVLGIEEGFSVYILCIEW